MGIKSNLGKLMEKRNLTYDELGSISKVAPDTISRVKDERIKTVKLLTLEKIAIALNVKIKDLFDEND